MDTHVQNTSHKRLLLLIETDTASSLDVCILNVQVACAFTCCQIRELEHVSSIPEDMLRVWLGEKRWTWLMILLDDVDV